MPDSAARAAEVLTDLCQPGQTLAFCDETEITGPVEGLVPDLRILCAVVMPSEHYAVIAPAIEARLAALGQTEFRGKEIVNPPNASTWRGVPLPDRLEAFRFIGQALSAEPTRLFYIFVSKGQYEELKQEAEKLGPVSLGYKAGLKRVFVRCLCEKLAQEGGEVAVILDQTKPQAVPSVEAVPEGAFLKGGGPIIARSATLPGLQLADMAAYCVGRYRRRRAQFEGDGIDAFDHVIIETIVAFAGRTAHLLNEGKRSPAKRWIEARLCSVLNWIGMLFRRIRCTKEQVEMVASLAAALTCRTSSAVIASERPRTFARCRQGGCQSPQPLSPNSKAPLQGRLLRSWFRSATPSA